MASRSFFMDMKSSQPGIVKIAGSFAPNNTSALVATSTYGKGFTVARTDTGKFTITLSDTYTRLENFTGIIALTAVLDLKLQLGAVDVTSAKTIVLNVLAIATPTDIVANAANRIYFELSLVNSSL